LELDDALTQISEIRQQMAASAVFRGYRPLTTAVTAVLAFVAAGLQAWLVPDPAGEIQSYLFIWFGAALLGVVIVGVEMMVRTARSGSSLQRETTRHAVDQFVPCLVAGATATFAIVEHNAWARGLLPGLWMVLFSLGVFASRRFLPRGAFAVAGYYLLAGIYCLTLPTQRALSPWTMGAAFGAGQLFAAAVLHWFLEREHARRE
jgi:hypothetical protein